MKKKLLAFFLALIALFICSCSVKMQDESKIETTSSVLDDDDYETGTIAGDYIYRVIDANLPISGSLLLKYHIPTGTVTTVCQDPFCNHDMGCPFNIYVGHMTSIGAMLYYVAEEDEQQFLRSYSGDDMKIEQLHTSNGVLTNLFSYNYYLYFSEILPDDNGDYKVTYYRLDTQTNAKIDIHNTDKSERIYDIKDKTIIWKTKTENYYTTDLNGNNRKKEKNPFLSWGNFKYRNESKPKDHPWEIKMDVYRKNISTDEETLIATDIGPYFIYGDKIIYFKQLDEREFVDEINGIYVYNYYEDNVYIMNLDGSDNHVLCHVDDIKFGSFSSNQNNKLRSGDWVGIFANVYYEDKYGQKMLFSDLLLVNIVTGEYKYIAYNPYE